MFDCNNCKNKMICKNKFMAVNIRNEINKLKETYKEFYGRIDVKCDYFIAEQLERTIEG